MQRAEQTKMIFEVFPDDVVINLLQFCDDKSISNTRMWQSKGVQECVDGGLTLEKAVKRSNLGNLKWLKNVMGDEKFRNGKLASTLQRCMELAVQQGDLNIMKWLHENGAQLDEETFHAAARLGSLENMKWLKENQCPWGISTWCAAKLECARKELKSVENQIYDDDNTLDAAKAKCTVDNLIWLTENLFGQDY